MRLEAEHIAEQRVKISSFISLIEGLSPSAGNKVDYEMLMMALKN